jgi:tetratricopeptide (TPR) repeat protein
MLDTVREYVLEQLTETGELGATRGSHAEHFAGLADEARVELRGPEWLQWERRLEVENDNLWAALSYAPDASDPLVASRLGTLGWYFGLAGRVSEGRRYVDLAAAASPEDAPVELRVEVLADLCYLATEEGDLEAALAAGERALSLAAAGAPPRQLGLARLTLALALAQAGREERVDALAREAATALEVAGDDWGVAASSLIRGIRAARAGDVSTVAAMAAVVRRHSDAIRYDAFRVPGLLLEAWVAERRQHGAAAVEAYRRALELAAGVGFDDHAAFALAGLGSNALARGDLREAEELLGQALAAAEAARAAWVVAHARVQLARNAAAAGDVDTAERLYREVVEWSQKPRPRQARESLFLALAGSPATAALVGLAEIAEVRGDTASADDLRGRAGRALS